MLFRFEDCKKMKQQFSDKIQYKCNEQTAFIGYKRNRLLVLEQSGLNNEEYLDKQRAKFLRLRAVLKYRLFGMDGITQKEFYSLV